MMHKRERAAWVLLFLVTAAFILAPYITTPRPYWRVQLVGTYQDGPWRYITANFVKGDCARRDVVFSGHRLGIVDNLTSGWEGMDGADDGHDRLAGTQTLHGRLYTGDVQYEAFEIRTRHDCTGQRVDKLFLRIEADAPN